jgi:hypothetical protein
MPVVNLNLGQSAPLILQAIGDAGVLAELRAAFYKGAISFQIVAEYGNTEPPSVAFERLASQWRKDTRFISPVKRKVLHPAYQQIIGMGETAISLILRSLEQQPEDWLWALKAITREDPARDSDNFGQAIERLLRWGKERGYI